MCKCGKAVDGYDAHLVMEAIDVLASNLLEAVEAEGDRALGKPMCYQCGKPCDGVTGAIINDVFMAMCHEGTSPTCYEEWQWDHASLEHAPLLDALMGGSFNG